MIKYKLFNNKWVYGVLAGLLATICYFVVPSNEYPNAPIMAAIVTVMAVFWIFEVVPIAITSLFPIFLFPLFGILDTKATALFYGKEIMNDKSVR